MRDCGKLVLNASRTVGTSRPRSSQSRFMCLWHLCYGIAKRIRDSEHRNGARRLIRKPHGSGDGFFTGGRVTHVDRDQDSFHICWKQRRRWDLSVFVHGLGCSPAIDARCKFERRWLAENGEATIRRPSRGRTEVLAPFSKHHDRTIGFSAHAWAGGGLKDEFYSAPIARPDNDQVSAPSVSLIKDCILSKPVPSSQNGTDRRTCWRRADLLWIRPVHAGRSVLESAKCCPYPLRQMLDHCSRLTDFE